LSDLLRCYITKHATAVALAGLPEEYEIARAIIGDWQHFDMNQAHMKISKQEAKLSCVDNVGGDRLHYSKDSCPRSSHQSTN